MPNLLPASLAQFCDANGNPYAAGTVGFYIPSTMSAKTTWSDSAGTIANTNPVVLDSAGRASIWGSGAYRMILKDAAGNLVWDQVTSSGDSGAYDPRWYGAKFDGTTNDTTAIQTCINAASAAGSAVRLPSGSTVCSGLTLPASLAFIGAGRWETILINPSATANTITATAGKNTISGMRFTASVTRTAGTFVNFGTGEYCTLSDFSMQGYWIGIQSSGTILAIRDGTMENGVGGTAGVANGPGGIAIGGTAQGFDQLIENLTITNAGQPQPSYGILILQSGDVTIDDCNIISCGYDLMIAPASGQQVSSVWAQNTFFDTATTGIAIVPTGTGDVVRCRFDGCWTSSHTNNGVTLGGVGGAGGTCAGFHFTNHQGMFNTTSSGLAVYPPFYDVLVNGGMWTGNVNGIFLAATVSDFSIVNAMIGLGAGYGSGNSAYGVFVTAGASDHYVIANNRGRGNGTALIADNGTGSNKYVGNNIA